MEGRKMEKDDDPDYIARPQEEGDHDQPPSAKQSKRNRYWDDNSAEPNMKTLRYGGDVERVSTAQSPQTSAVSSQDALQVELPRWRERNQSQATATATSGILAAFLEAQTNSATRSTQKEASPQSQEPTFNTASAPVLLRNTQQLGQSLNYSPLQRTPGGQATTGSLPHWGHTPNSQDNILQLLQHLFSNYRSAQVGAAQQPQAERIVSPQAPRPLQGTSALNWAPSLLVGQQQSAWHTTQTTIPNLGQLRQLVETQLPQPTSSVHTHASAASPTTSANQSQQPEWFIPALLWIRNQESLRAEQAGTREILTAAYQYHSAMAEGLRDGRTFPPQSGHHHHQTHRVSESSVNQSIARAPASTSSTKAVGATKPTPVASLEPVTIRFHLESDSQSLSLYQISIRRQLEFFVTQVQQEPTTARGRKKVIHDGQVGIRCIHCALSPLHYRGRGSVFYPGKLNGVYQAAQNIASTHLADACHAASDEMKEQLRELRAQKTSRSGRKQYWVDACNMIGLFETEEGIFLRQTSPYATKSNSTP